MPQSHCLVTVVVEDIMGKLPEDWSHQSPALRRRYIDDTLARKLHSLPQGGRATLTAEIVRKLEPVIKG